MKSGLEGKTPRHERIVKQNTSRTSSRIRFYRTLPQSGWHQTESTMTHTSSLNPQWLGADCVLATPGERLTGSRPRGPTQAQEARGAGLTDTQHTSNPQTWAPGSPAQDQDSDKSPSYLHGASFDNDYIKSQALRARKPDWFHPLTEQMNDGGELTCPRSWRGQASGLEWKPPDILRLIPTPYRILKMQLPYHKYDLRINIFIYFYNKYVISAKYLVFRYLTVMLITLLNHETSFKNHMTGLPWWRSGWESACQCRGHGFEPWSGKIPHAVEQLGPWATITELARLELVPRNKRGCDNERPAHHDEKWPPLAPTRESPRTETKTQHSHK